MASIDSPRGNSQAVFDPAGLVQPDPAGFATSRQQQTGQLQVLAASPSRILLSGLQASLVTPVRDSIDLFESATRIDPELLDSKNRDELIKELKTQTEQIIGEINDFLKKAEEVDKGRAKKSPTEKSTSETKVHNLRKPLTVISGLCEQLNTEDTSDRKEIIKDIQDAYNYLSSVVGDLNKRNFTIEKLVNDSQFLWKHASKHVEIKLDDTVKDQKLVGESGKLQEILANLISNALDFCTEKVILEVQGKNDGSQVHLNFSVYDDGKGIPKKAQKNLFQKFAKLEQPAANPNRVSTGLGLVSCQQHVEDLGGLSIQVESDPEKEPGTRFVFDLTFKKSESLVPKLSFASGSSSAPTTPLTTLKSIHKDGPAILVADDHEATRKLYQRFFDKHKFQPVFVADGSFAVAEFEKNYYDVVILDREMLVMHGLEAAEKILNISKEKFEKYPPPKIYFLTGHNKDDAMVALGEVITKPVKLDKQVPQWVGEAKDIFYKRASSTGSVLDLP